MERADVPHRERVPRPDDSVAEECAALIKGRSGVRPWVTVVLGSGLGEAISSQFVLDQEFSFEVLPGFPPPSVPGHAGKLALGELCGQPAAVFHGRVHFYEGHGIASTTLVTRVAAELGSSTIVLTNAAGGLDPTMRVGQLMLIRDHINLIGANPLWGWRYPAGTPAFVDLSHVYDRTIRALALEIAGEAGVDVTEGVYAAVSGPSYETPAETEYLAGIGAHAVGMSTVPEAVAAAALGLSVLGISCITDVAGTELTHDEVLAASRSAAPAVGDILQGLIPALAPSATAAPMRETGSMGSDEAD
jgi:purine-nucleoside phosphorylase